MERCGQDCTCEGLSARGRIVVPDKFLGPHLHFQISAAAGPLRYKASLFRMLPSVVFVLSASYNDISSERLTF